MTYREEKPKRKLGFLQGRGRALTVADLPDNLHKDPYDVKVLKGFGGAGVPEVVENDIGGTCRAVYTVKFEMAALSEFLLL